MDKLQVGKIVVLRPSGTFNKKSKAVAINFKKQHAQDMYYKKNIIKPDMPVHERLGGAINKQQKRRKWLFNMNQTEWVKPRIRKTSNGFVTHRYSQKAQQRLNLLRKRWAYECGPMNYQVQFSTNKKFKFPNIYHSVKHALDEKIQQEIKMLMEDCIRSNDIENELPLHNEDATKLSLHERFSLYP